MLFYQALEIIGDLSKLIIECTRKLKSNTSKNYRSILVRKSINSTLNSIQTSYDCLGCLIYKLAVRPEKY